MHFASFKGFLTAGLDFEDTYAPTPEHFSNLFLQAYALMEKWHRDGFDISTAYLQSDKSLNECGTIVMGYPRGFGGVGPDKKPLRFAPPRAGDTASQSLPSPSTNVRRMKADEVGVQSDSSHPWPISPFRARSVPTPSPPSSLGGQKRFYRKMAASA